MKFTGCCAFGRRCAAVLFFISVNSFAGFRDDHFVAWISLGKGANSREVSRKIDEFANSDRVNSTCKINWTGNDSMLYLNATIPGVSDKLIKGLFIERDGSYFPKINHALRNFRDAEANVRDGLDGIIFYDGEQSFRMMSFTAGRRGIKTYPLILNASSKAEEIESAFCALIPPITRAP
ncbi:hypothetical protein NWF24_01330 [Variovorax paradoxus]|uniref:hypothetical protein n=1 Tax=Variovorax paradoxus TaxID=34073 RepID=UPI0021ACC8DB|nr:hypothetical protein [Variovorax paradoxus]UVH58081.1 hypothetical protein NWF24_01330 [Variovorax paradoxus]